MKYIKKQRDIPAIRFAICIILLIFSIISTLYIFFENDTSYDLAIICSIILFTIICILLIIKSSGDLMEPIYLFSCMYMTGCFCCWYLIYSDFTSNIYIHLTEYNKDFSELFNESVFYYLIGYIFLLGGYSLVPSVIKRDNMAFTSKAKLPDIHVKMVFLCCYALGLINFIYNIWISASGNLFLYLRNISVRTYEFAEKGTTLGYNFTYVGIYFLEFLYLRNKKKLDFKFYILFGISIIMMFSVGRIFLTMAYIATIFAVQYFYLYGKRKLNTRYFLIGILTVLMGIGAYFFRVLSSFLYNDMVKGSSLNFLGSLVQKIAYYAFDKGNAVNLAILPKIFDAWDSEIGFLMGESLFTSLNSILHSNIIVSSHVVRVEWFTQATNGNLPVTIVGDLFINFGKLGIVFGMFIFGMFMKYIYNILCRRLSFWSILLYCILLTQFIAILPKCDFSNFPSFNLLFTTSMIFILKSFGEIKLCLENIRPESKEG